MEEERRGADSCQHSKVDCFAALAEMVVIFKVLGVVAVAVDIKSPCRRRKSTANGILMEPEAIRFDGRIPELPRVCCVLVLA